MYMPLVEDFKDIAERLNQLQGKVEFNIYDHLHLPPAELVKLLPVQPIWPSFDEAIDLINEYDAIAVKRNGSMREGSVVDTRLLISSYPLAE
jgi:hypothetical protein